MISRPLEAILSINTVGVVFLSVLGIFMGIKMSNLNKQVISMEDAVSNIGSRLVTVEDILSDNVGVRLDKVEDILSDNVGARLDKVEDILSDNVGARLDKVEDILSESIGKRLNKVENILNENIEDRLDKVENALNSNIGNRLDKVEDSLSRNVSKRLDSVESILNNSNDLINIKSHMSSLENELREVKNKLNSEVRNNNETNSLKLERENRTCKSSVQFNIPKFTTDDESLKVKPKISHRRARSNSFIKTNNSTNKFRDNKDSNIPLKRNCRAKSSEHFTNINDIENNDN